jgi:hypothetical protein
MSYFSLVLFCNILIAFVTSTVRILFYYVLPIYPFLNMTFQITLYVVHIFECNK